MFCDITVQNDLQNNQKYLMSLIFPNIFFNSVCNLLLLELYKYFPEFLAETEKTDANPIIFNFSYNLDVYIIELSIYS